MKYKLLRFYLMSILAMLGGSAFAQEEEAKLYTWDFTLANSAATLVGGGEGQGAEYAYPSDIDADVKLEVNATNGKFSPRGNDVQVNATTVIKVPVRAKGDIITVYNYRNGSNGVGYTIGSESKTAADVKYEYTVNKTEANDGYVLITVTSSGYMDKFSVLQHKPEAEGGKTYTNEAGTINWLIGNEQTPVISDEVKDAFSSASVSVGSGLTVSTAKYFDTDMVDYRPLTKNAGTVEGVMIEYRVKPATGVKFTPTKIEYAAVKVGTDNATYSWSYTVDGVESTITKIDPKPDLLRNNGANSSTAKLMHTETFSSVGECDEFTFRFYISDTANDKDICIGNVTISGIVNGTAATVNKYTLATVAAPAEGGTVSVYPVADEYEEGSTIKLTATENFGYDFVNWTNENGDEVSTDAVYTFDINQNETLTANFQAVDTYELSLTVDGTNDYMVTINPAPTMVEDKMMYEAGTAIQLTANQYSGLVTFNNWSDGETNSTKLISMTEDVTLTAIYSQADIIAGWDFYKGGNSGRLADFASEDNESAALDLVKTDNPTTTASWLDKSTEKAGGYESFKGAAVNWTTGTGNGDVGHYHWQAKINASQFTDINVQFQMLYNYNAYQTYNAEYSTDGENWTTFGSITMTGTKKATSFKQALPAEANNQANLYIRMVADKTSAVDGAASANDGNTLAMFFITGTQAIVDDGKAPVLISTVPAYNANGVSANGKIVLTFNEKVQVLGGAKGVMGVFKDDIPLWEVEPIVSGKTITFEYKGLDYLSIYAFMMVGNTIADLSGNAIEEDIKLSFITMERPAVTKGLYDYVVENVDDLMAAINEANSRSDKNKRYRIFVKNGTYALPLSNENINSDDGNTYPSPITKLSASNISIIGESRDGVIITNLPDGSATYDGTYGKTSVYDGISKSDVLQIQSSATGTYFQDLTVKSGIGDALGRNLALQDRGHMTIYKNVGLHGYQDTWTSNNDNGLYYFEGGYVRGRTDYMCGKGDAFFNGVELRQIAGGYAAVPSKSIKYGFVYKDCVINGEAATVNSTTGDTRTATQADGNYTLGRPWGQGTPIALYINTKMNVKPSAIGWNEMSNGWPKRFAEFNSTSGNGNAIDLSGRKKTFGDGHTNDPVLTAEEALEAGDLHNMFGDWDPTLDTEQAPIPVKVVQKGAKLSWSNSEYALLWAIVKDGNVVDFTITNSYELNEPGTYAVRAANEMGGLSEASESVTVTDIYETVTIPASGYATLSSCKALDFSAVEGLTAYIVTSKSETKAQLTSVTTAPAATGLVVKGDANTTYTIPLATGEVDAITNNLLKPAVEKTPVESRSVYVLESGEFCVFTGTAIPAGKAYLPMSDGSTRTLQITIDDATTVTPVEVANGQTDVPVYNLNGQRIAQPRKGVYIMRQGKKGNKMIVK